jgi:hypothetical protein
VALLVLYLLFKGKPFDTTFKKDEKTGKEVAVKGPILDNLMKFYNLSCVCLASSSAFGVIGYLVLHGLKFSGNPQMTTDTTHGKAWLQWVQCSGFWSFLESHIVVARGCYRDPSLLV